MTVMLQDTSLQYLFLPEELAGYHWAVAWLLQVCLSLWLPCLDLTVTLLHCCGPPQGCL